MSRGSATLGWSGIVRLGLVQAALGAVVVMATTTLNRVMTVELALPALLPGALVATHYAVQILRPRWGHGSDGLDRRSPWILAGMVALAAGGMGAAFGVAMMSTAPLAGIALTGLSYLLIGAGVGAAGTSLLTLAATRVAPDRRAAAASTIWIMMIAGFAVTAAIAGRFLDPFSMPRLVAVVGCVCVTAVLVSAVALIGIEGRDGQSGHSAPRPLDHRSRPDFRAALAEVWSEGATRRFTLYVFVSMLAYSSLDLVLDPFAGQVLGLSIGATTRLSGLQHSGAVIGMLGVMAAGVRWRRPSFLVACAVCGCLVSSFMLFGLTLAGAGAPLRGIVMLLGFGNGVFAVASIGLMMTLASAGAPGRAGLRMGLWGAAQAMALGLGALAGPGLVQAGSALLAAPAQAYMGVFLFEAILFLLAAFLVAIARPRSAAATEPPPWLTVSA